MATSPEYPDLRWMPPKSWTDANRSSVQVIVIHTTEGSAHGQSAEDGASYDQRRTDGTSTHYFVDSDTVVQCVRTSDQAHTARSQGNRRGIQYELCGRTTLDWGGAYAQAMLRRAAKQAARDCKKWDIPVRKLSPTQVAAGSKGFCGHADITYAFPQDNGTHTDPGKNFPWSQFLELVRDEMEDDVALTADDKTWLADKIDDAATAAAQRVWASRFNIEFGTNPDGTPRPQYLAPMSSVLAHVPAEHGAHAVALAAIATAVSNLAGSDLVNEQEIVLGVLTGLPVPALIEGIVSALPPEMARQLADELAARLAT